MLAHSWFPPHAQRHTDHPFVVLLDDAIFTQQTIASTVVIADNPFFHCSAQKKCEKPAFFQWRWTLFKLVSN